MFSFSYIRALCVKYAAMENFDSVTYSQDNHVINKSS